MNLPRSKASGAASGGVRLSCYDYPADDRPLPVRVGLDESGLCTIDHGIHHRLKGLEGGWHFLANIG